MGELATQYPRQGNAYTGSGGRHRNEFRLMYCVLSLVLPFLIVAGYVKSVQAQTSQASVRGSVHDASGAVVSGANIKLSNLETHVDTISTTNDQGDYLFLGVNPGTYTLEASGAGFSTQKLKPFPLQVNQTASLDFKLPVGTVDQVIEVDAVGAGVEAATAELGSTLGSKQVEDLPLNGRNFTSLFATVPGVSPIVPGGSQTASYTTVIGPVIIPSVNGQTNRSDLFYLDGILDIETFGNAYAVQPIIDTIQDQKLQSHNDSAEFGGATGGTINIATKSGTNSFHGSAWEFNKATGLQAIPYFTPSGTVRTQLSQNQYGGTFSGPVIIPKLYNGRDKTFFFGAYEGFRYSSPGTTYMTVPTAAQLAGDFTADPTPIYDPATTTCNSQGTCTRKQFAYRGIPNMIDPSRLNQGNIYYAKYALPAIAPAGSNLPSGTNASQSSPTTESLWSYDARVDETLGQKDSGFFRLSGIRGSSTSGRSQLPYALITNGYQYVGGYVHVFSSTSVLHVQAGSTYESRTASQRFQGLPSDFLSVEGFPSGLTSGYITLGTVVPGNSVPGYFSDTGESGGPQVTADGWSVKGDFTHILGKHTFKLGAEFNKIGESQDIQYANVTYAAGDTSSGTAGSGGESIASFLIGAPTAATKRNLQESLSFGGVMGIYFQDQYQVTPKLTLNVGLRYDLGIIPKYGTPAANNQASGNFDFNTGNYVVYKVPGSCATLGTAPCIPTSDGSLPPNVVASSDGKVLENTNLNIQPRLGFAYRINPTTVIRGGAGVAFDEYAGLVQNVRGVSGNWPSVGQIQQGNFNTPTTANPFPNITPQNIPNLTTLPPPTPFQLQNWYVDPKMKNAYSYQWNLGVQHQLNASTVVSATYVGSKNKRLDVGGVYNVALIPGPGNPTLRQPYPYITPTFYSKSNGEGNYNSMQLQLNRSFTHGTAATVAYTWQKSIDEGCSGFFGSEGCDVQQIYNLKAERSVAAFDVPQNLVASLNYELPIGRGKALNIMNKAVDAIVGGWQINGITSFHSGTPYSVHISTDVANIGGVSWWPYERANVVSSSVPSRRSANHWLNPAGFAIPAQYTYGNMGRNSLRTQFSESLDSSVFKTVSIERFKVELRGEAFNILNHKIFGQPNSTLDDVQHFGVITGTNSSARQIQLGAKLLF